MEVTRIYTILERLYPDPQIELHFTNHYTLLVAIALSAQATDVSVNKVTKDLFKTLSTPQDMLQMGEDTLKEHIKSIGLYNSKARNLVAAATVLIDKHGGVVPTTFEDLINLPGVGRKTANVWLNVALQIPTIAVDTHVNRVSNRLGLANSKDPFKVEQQLIASTPPEFLLRAHLWLILHGRRVCKAIKPLCSNCELNNLCSYWKN